MQKKITKVVIFGGEYKLKLIEKRQQKIKEAQKSRGACFASSFEIYISERTFICKYIHIKIRDVCRLLHCRNIISITRKIKTERFHRYNSCKGVKKANQNKLQTESSDDFLHFLLFTHILTSTFSSRQGVFVVNPT